MKPYYSDSLVTLYHGDCRDVVADLPDASIALLATDPPYGQQFHGQALITEKANIRADGARQGMRLVRELLFTLQPKIQPDAHALVFCHWESWPDFYDAVASYLQIRNALIWWKNRGGVGDTEMDYARDYEVILYASATGRRPLIGKRPCALLHGYPPVGADRVHPTEKPEPLMRTLIERHCPENETTLDPFAGSGTTLVAAKRMGRRAIGVEIEERWCQEAAERLSQGTLSEMFA